VATDTEQAVGEIIQTLTLEYGCHAVILYGSRARGDFQSTSDWDVAGIREVGTTSPLRVARAFHGAWLDAFVYTEAAFAVIDPELLRFLPARILVDDRGFAKTLLDRVAALDQQGPPPLTDGESEMVRVWYAKMIERIARGDLESKYRQVESSVHSCVDNRPIRVFVLGMHDIAFEAGRTGSIFDMMQPLRCDGAHSRRVRFERIRRQVRLKRNELEGRRDGDARHFGVYGLGQSHPVIDRLLGEFRAVRGKENMCVHDDALPS